MTPYITIGMASSNNPQEVWWTCQALRLYQDLEDCELLVIDNSDSSTVQKICRDVKVRCITYTDVRGTAMPRNKVFECANGNFVLCIDSHVFLWPEAISKLRKWVKKNYNAARCLIHGPIVMSNLESAFFNYEDQWRAGMWGIWPKKPARTFEMNELPKQINLMACGLMGCRKDSWLGFCSKCQGFGGVEGVLHQKYKKAGRKILSLPFLKWCHYFAPTKKVSDITDRVINFIHGFKELKMEYPKEFINEFGISIIRKCERVINDSRPNGNS